MRTALPSTVEALKYAHKICRTLDRVIEVYGISGVSKGTLSRIESRLGGVSRTKEYEVRRALGITSEPGSPSLRPRLPRDPQARIAKLQALLRQAEAELQEAA